jgi:hypothetical protein
VDNARPLRHPNNGANGGCECLPGYLEVADSEGKFAGCGIDLRSACDMSLISSGIENAVLNGCPSDVLTDGESCTFICDEGFTSEGTGGTIACEDRGELEQSVPTVDGVAVASLSAWGAQCTKPRCNTASEFVVANQGDSAVCSESSDLETGESCKLVCKDGYSATGGGNMTCTRGILSRAACVPNDCGPGEESVGSKCARCEPNFYSPSGQKCEQCPANSKPSASSAYCRCADGYYYDHWTPGLSADEACKECVDRDVRCRSLNDEVMVVEGRGGSAEDRTEGYWIAPNPSLDGLNPSMPSALHCIPGNCISCDDAAMTRDGLKLEHLLPERLVELLGQSGYVMKSHMHSTIIAPNSAAKTVTNSTDSDLPLDETAAVMNTTGSDLLANGICTGGSTRLACQVRKTPSWPREDFSLLSLYSHRNTWVNLHILSQPNTFLAPAAGGRHVLPAGARGCAVRALQRALGEGEGALHAMPVLRLLEAAVAVRILSRTVRVLLAESDAQDAERGRR